MMVHHRLFPDLIQYWNSRTSPSAITSGDSDERISAALWKPKNTERNPLQYPKSAIRFLFTQTLRIGEGIFELAPGFRTIG